MNALNKKMDLEEITEVKADSKNRISLGKKMKLAGRHFRVWRERSSGRIILEPVVLIPVSHHWLETSPEAKASVERGLSDAKTGQLHKAPEDFSNYIDKE